MIYIVGELEADGSMSPYVKVGFVSGGLDTFDERVERRVNQLQVGNPRRLVMIAVCKGEREREKEIHRMFPSMRVRRPHVTEWLRLEGEFGAWVDTVRLPVPRLFGRPEPKPPVPRVVVGRVGPRQKHPCAVCGSTEHTRTLCPERLSLARTVQRAFRPGPIRIKRQERESLTERGWLWRGKIRPLRTPI